LQVVVPTQHGHIGGHLLKLRRQLLLLLS
jgi:hypothetical protein